MISNFDTNTLPYDSVSAINDEQNNDCDILTIPEQMDNWGDISIIFSDENDASTNPEEIDDWDVSTIADEDEDDWHNDLDQNELDRVKNIEYHEWASQLSRLLNFRVLNLEMDTIVQCCANALNVDPMYLTTDRHVYICYMFKLQIEIEKLNLIKKNDEIELEEFMNVNIQLAELRIQLVNIIMPELYDIAEKALETTIEKCNIMARYLL